MLFKLSNLNSNLALTLGYLSPALNNSAQNAAVSVILLAIICCWYITTGLSMKVTFKYAAFITDRAFINTHGFKRLLRMGLL